MVTKFPEAVLGENVSPLTANVPTFGDESGYRIDADPNLAPARESRFVFPCVCSCWACLVFDVTSFCFLSPSLSRLLVSSISSHLILCPIFHV